LAVLATSAVSDLLRASERHPVILIYGGDESAVRELASGLVKAAAGSLDDPFAVTRLEDAQLLKNKGVLADEAAAMPLLGGRRVVWVTGASQGFLAAVQSLLESQAKLNLIVAEAGALAKSSALRTLFEKSAKAAVVPIYEDDPERVRRVIVEHLRGVNLAAADDAVERLMELTGPTRAQLRQELAKLALYCAARREVTVEDVEAVCGEAAEPSADDVCDAAFGGKLEDADQHMRRLASAGLAGGQLVSSLLVHAARLREMRAAMVAGKPASLAMSSVRPPIFFKRKSAITQQLDLWDLPALDRAATTLMTAFVQTREQRDLEIDIAQRSILSIARLAGRR
jgi:DNA polymerase III subunit delta